MILKKFPKITKAVRVTFLLAILFGLVLSFVLNHSVTHPVLAEEEDIYKELKIFSEAISMLQKNYVEPVKTKDISYGAIRGILNTLDAHSSFMTPEVYKEMQIDTKGEFGGLGIQIGLKGGRVVVIAPIDGTPAHRAGIKAGDMILEVDGQAFTKEINLMDAVNKMRGSPGTAVSLTIGREGQPEPLTFRLTREIIQIKSVKSKMLEPGIAYIRLVQFQEQTGKDLIDALDPLRKDLHSLVLDLRNNPGGLLTAAVEVSEVFLPAGKAIVSIRGRNTKENEFVAKNANPIDGTPIVVLVNNGSASASEIVAGALQDWGRAVVLGTQTFGKGSVQTILPLSDGSALRLTTAKYYTPKGRSIQNTGITPDVILEPPAALQNAKNRMIREKDLDRHLKNETAPDAETSKEVPIPSPTPSLPDRSPVDSALEDLVTDPDPLKDPQVQKAVDLLKTWRIFKNLPPTHTTAQNAP